MDNISELLQEAKPLYFERKKHQIRNKIAIGVMLPMIFGTMLFLGGNFYNQIEFSLLNSNSVLSEMGLPTDSEALTAAEEKRIEQLKSDEKKLRQEANQIRKANMLAFEEILNPEQKIEFAKIKQERKQKMEANRKKHAKCFNEKSQHKHSTKDFSPNHE
jgi:hypothetical protein